MITENWTTNQGETHKTKDGLLLEKTKGEMKGYRVTPTPKQR